MKPESKKYITSIGGRPLTFESGKLAAQAGGAVTVQFGDSVVFAAATMGNEPRMGQDFFPSRSSTKNVCTPVEKSPVRSSAAKADRVRMPFWWRA
jgi:hypothetical protein